MSADDVTALVPFSAATVFEAAGRRNALDRQIQRLVVGQRVCGVAFTVTCAPGDNLAIHRAIEAVADGQVLVIGTSGGIERSYLGAVIARAAQLRGVLGIVLDGLVRDSDELRALGLPLFCRGPALIGASKTEAGEVGTPTLCGGIRIASGDVIVADGDGVVAVPSRCILSIAAAARVRDSADKEVLAGLADGRLTLDLLELRGEGAATCA